MSRRTLDRLALALLAAAALAVSQAPMLHPVAGLTLTLPEYISDPSEPAMEVNDDGTLDPTFEAWAVGRLGKGAR